MKKAITNLEIMDRSKIEIRNPHLKSLWLIEIEALVLFSWPFYPLKLCFVETKIHSFLKQWSSFYENKVLQLISAWASLEMFGERTLFS